MSDKVLKATKKEYNPPYNQTLVKELDKMSEKVYNNAKVMAEKTFGAGKTGDELIELLDKDQRILYNNLLAGLVKYKPFEIKELFAYMLLNDINKELFDLGDE